MKKLLVLLLILLAGCVQPAETPVNKEVVFAEDTVLEAPTITPTGYVTSKDQTITITFKEPVVITNFTINSNISTLTSTDKKVFKHSGTFEDGSYQLNVKAIDIAGNNVSSFVLFNVDSTTPTLTVTPADSASIATTSVDFSLVFSEAVTLVTSKVDSIAKSFSTTDNKTFSLSLTLAEGDHTLEASGKDRAGNTVSKTVAFTVALVADTTPPAQVSGFTATNVGDGSSIRLSWTANSEGDFGGYQIFKADSTFSTITGLMAYQTITSRTNTAFTAGNLDENKEYCFNIRAYDVSLNYGPITTTKCVTVEEVDSNEPTITDYSPTGTIEVNTFEVNVTTNEKATCRARIVDSSLDPEDNITYDDMRGSNGFTFSTNSSGLFHYSTKTLENSTYTIFVRCKDVDDNVMTSSDNWEIVVNAPDTTAPTITIVSPLTTTYTDNSTIWLNITTDENAFWCGYSWNGDNTSTMSGSDSSWHANKTDVADGIYPINFFCNDSSGNMGTDSVNATIDTTAPSITVSYPDGEMFNESIDFTITATDGVDSEPTCDVYVNGTLWGSDDLSSGVETNITVDVSSETAGYYEYYVNCSDDAGNVVQSTTYDFTVDLPPTRVLTAEITNGTITDSSIFLNWTDYSAPSDIEKYEIFASTSTFSDVSSLSRNETTTNSTFDYTGLNNGTTYYFIIVSIDGNGNKFTTGLNPKSFTTLA